MYRHLPCLVQAHRPVGLLMSPRQLTLGEDGVSALGFTRLHISSLCFQLPIKRGVWRPGKILLRDLIALMQLEVHSIGGCQNVSS